jgi:hypothetical protein
MNTHTIRQGDSLTPLGMKLKRKNTSGVLASVDLTGKTVKVLIRDPAGNVVLDETETGVTVTSAANGEVSYDFPAGLDALDAGTYFLEALVYSGTERDTYPVEPKEMKIAVKAHGTNAVS